jgi:hypothetical protein
MFSVTCSITVTLLRIAFSIDFLVFSKAPSCPHCVSWILVLRKNYQLSEVRKEPSEYGVTKVHKRTGFSNRSKDNRVTSGVFPLIYGIVMIAVNLLMDQIYKGNISIGVPINLES